MSRCFIPSAQRRRLRNSSTVSPASRDDSQAVSEDNVLSLASDSEAALLERSNGIEMIDARELGHRSGDLDLPNFRSEEQVISDGQVLTDRFSDVLEGFGFCNTL